MLKQELRLARSKIHFTVDTWTSPNYTEFQAITGHFIDKAGQLRNALLGLPELVAGHSGSETAQLFQETVNKLEISHKLGWVTSDNASCNDTMMKELSIWLEGEGVV